MARKNCDASSILSACGAGLCASRCHRPAFNFIRRCRRDEHAEKCESRRRGRDPLPGAGLFAKRSVDRAAIDVNNLRVDRRFLRSVAHHKSGHALVDLICGRPVAGATVNYEGGHFGRVWADNDHRGDDSGEIFDLIAQLARLMPPPFASRDDAAIEIIGSHDQIVAAAPPP
jgi:hypothetical protein